MWQVLRNRFVALAIVLVVAAALLIARSDDAGTVPAGDPLLPDLWSSAPFELRIDIVDGRHVIRFTSEINNQGTGELLVRGSARAGVFSQWIAHSSSGYTVAPMTAAIVWGGDTHFHWHIEDVARYWIEPRGEPGGAGRADNKVGFCFFDGVDRKSELSAAPAKAVHSSDGCGGRLDPAIAMGLSVGWGDQYRFDLDGQWIDIDDLATGQYQLVAQVDPDGLFFESDTSNNTASTDFTLLVSESGTPQLLLG